MGRSGSRRRKKTAHQHHAQESRYEHAVAEQRREREAIVENFGISGSGAGKWVVGTVAVVLVVAAILALLALITFR